MTVSSTLLGTLLHGTAAARPAANAVAGGTIYSATDTGAITQSDGSSWATFATISSGLADPMTTRGDIIVRNASNVTARLGIGSSGKVLQSDGTDISWQTPSGSGNLAGTELDYAQVTSGVDPSGTNEATATTLVTGASVAYDGATVVMARFFCQDVAGSTTGWLYEDGTSIGAMFNYLHTNRGPVLAERRITPSNASHTYSVRASGNTSSYRCGAGGNATNPPMFIQIIRLSS